MPTGFFLDAKDLGTFEEDRQIYGRRLQAQSPAGRPSAQPLEAIMRDRASNYAADRAHGFYCFGVEVAPGDGMSWSATAADAAIEEVAPQVPRLYLQGRPGSGPLPVLAGIISMRRIAALAQRRGIARSARIFGSRRYVLIILAAIAVGAAGSVTSAAMTGSSSLTWPFVGLAVISAGLGIISPLINSRLNENSPTSPLIKIAEDIVAESKSDEPREAYWSFVADLAARLGSFAGFRCLIIDDFTNLDKMSRDVLDAYLKGVASDTKDEMWVLFYSSVDKQLEFQVSRPERRKPTGLRYTHIFRLEHLDSLQRRQLAEAAGAPERAVFTTVRAILSDDSGLAMLGTLCQEVYDNRGTRRGDTRDSDELDFFYLFALNAVWAGNPWMKTFDLQSNLSRETRFRSPILRILLPGFTARRTDISHAIDDVLRSFFPHAGDVSVLGRQRTFHVAPEMGEYLEKSWRKFDLANPGLVHLFWTLYWSDTELHGKPGVAMLRKVSNHLLKSTPPADLRARLKMGSAEITAFTDELYNTTIELLRSCLKTCLLADVADLMDYALRLSEDDRQAVERQRRARLRPLAWQAYGLLGDERLLAVIVDLDPAVKTADGAGRGADSELVDLFVRSLPRADTDVGRLMRNELRRRGVAKHAGAYAVARAGWLAASLSPFTGPVSPTFTAAAQDCRERLPGVVRESVDNLEAVADQEWRTTDILNVVLGLWSLGLAADSLRASPDLGWNHSEDLDATLVDSLVRTCLIATELCKQRREADPSPATIDLVLDCLAEELLAVVFAVALLILRRWPDDAWTTRASRLYVLNVVQESAQALGLTEQVPQSADGDLSSRLFQDAARQMTLLTVLWRRLGFAQLASFMAIRQAQFGALSDGGTANVAQATIELLTSDLEQTDQIGLLAHLAAAEGTQFSAQLMSSLVTRCSRLSISVGLSERTSAELCMIAVTLGHSFDIDFSACLDFLLGNRSGSIERRLEALLHDVPDTQLPNLVTAFLNTANRDKSARADDVCEVLERRIDDVDDAEIRKEARGDFMTFMMQRHRLLGRPVDVDVELDAWREMEMQDLPIYAFLLSVMLPMSAAATRDRVIRESLTVLRAGGDYLRATGYVYLARALFVLLHRSRGHGADEVAAGLSALSALRAGFEEWEQSLSAETNIDILRLLAQYDREHADEYAAKYLDWQQIVLELDETQRLPELVSQGRFFLLIWHYFEFFASDGLQSDPPTNSYGMDEQEVADVLREWCAGSRVPPNPVVGSPGHERLSGDFLRFGYALFTPIQQRQKGNGGMSESQLENDRRQFDEKARGVVETVYRMLGRLPRIPKSFEQILRRHEMFVLQHMDELERIPGA